MTKTFLAVLAGAAMIAVAGAASAHEPMQLSNAQLDQVTAGAIAVGTGSGFAIGTVGGGVSININTQAIGHFAFAAGDITSISASSHHNLAFSGSSLSLGISSP